MSPFLSTMDVLADEMGWSDSSDDEGSFSDFLDGLVKIPDDVGQNLQKRFFEEDISDDDDEDNDDDDEDMSEEDEEI